MTVTQHTRLQNQKEEQLLKLYESMNPQGQQHLMEFAQDTHTNLPKHRQKPVTQSPTRCTSTTVAENRHEPKEPPSRTF